ncbi:MAG: glycosyltransferase [Patescibacteria group bacterium]|jgi:GT2 family glycosyltransferase
MEKPIISIVLGSYNRLPFLRGAIDSIRKNGLDLSYEIIVIDGGSNDGSIKYLLSQKDIITIVQYNRGYWQGKAIERKNWGYFMNIAFRASHGKYIVMISDDCLILPGSISNAYKLFEEKLNLGKKVGAVAFYWRNYPKEEKYFVRLTLGLKMMVNHGMYLRQALENIDFFDEDHYFFYHADGDLCLRLWQKGYEVIDCDKAFVEHFDLVNTNVRLTNNTGRTECWQRYKQRWAGIFYDPIKDNNGSRKYLEFSDPHHTVRFFHRRKDFIKYKINQFFNKN